MECAGRAKRRRRFGLSLQAQNSSAKRTRWKRNFDPKRRRRFALPAHSKSARPSPATLIAISIKSYKLKSMSQLVSTDIPTAFAIGYHHLEPKP